MHRDSDGMASRPGSTHQKSSFRSVYYMIGEIKDLLELPNEMKAITIAIRKHVHWCVQRLQPSVVPFNSICVPRGAVCKVRRRSDGRGRVARRRRGYQGYGTRYSQARWRRARRAALPR